MEFFVGDGVPRMAGATQAFHERAVKRMNRIDEMPKEMRECVHEFGLTIVDAMLACGVKEARHIRHLVNTVREEGRFGNPKEPAAACGGNIKVSL